MDDKDKPLRLFVLIFGRLLLKQVAVLACVASKYLILCMTALICGCRHEDVIGYGPYFRPWGPSYSVRFPSLLLPRMEALPGGLAT